MTWEIKHGDALAVLRTVPGESVHCCVTSPPYWGLRDYGVPGQLGLEATPDEYVGKMVEVFREVRRVLRKDGTLWLNIGDPYASTPPGNTSIGVSAKSTLHGVNGASGQYRDTLSKSVQTKRSTIVAGLKPKDLVGIPWLLAFALRSDGWYLRQDIIWAKPNPMPESVTDRCTKSHEYLFLLSKSARYYCDMGAIREAALDPEDDIRRISQATLNGKSTPDAQRNGIRRSAPDSWNGSSFDEGKTGEMKHSRGGLKKTKIPGGWDIGEGAHGTIHRSGRTEAEYQDAVSDGKRNRRSVWEIATSPFPEAHFATFPPKLVEPCILAGCPEGGTVLDPFAGAGTTGLVATRLNRNFIGIELNAAYIEMANRRIEQDRPLFNTRERETPLRGGSPDIWK